MDTWAIVLIVIVILIACDFAVTAAYCYLSKKKSKVYRSDNVSDVKDVSSESPAPSKLSLKSIVRSYIEGYILYKCNMLMYLPSQTLRKFVLKYEYMMNLDWKAIIYHGSEFREPWNITIGEGASIGDHAVLDGRNGLVIDSNVNIGSRVFIWTEQHDYNDPYFRCNNKGGKVHIEPRVWLSAGTIILPKVTIKEGSVIAAGAVVTKDCESFALYGGVPAKKIGDRNKNLEYSLKDTYLHFY